MRRETGGECVTTRVGALVLQPWMETVSMTVEREKSADAAKDHYGTATERRARYKPKPGYAPCRVPQRNASAVGAGGMLAPRLRSVSASGP